MPRANSLTMSKPAPDQRHVAASFRNGTALGSHRAGTVTVAERHPRLRAASAFLTHPPPVGGIRQAAFTPRRSARAIRRRRTSASWTSRDVLRWAFVDELPKRRETMARSRMREFPSVCPMFAMAHRDVAASRTSPRTGFPAAMVSEPHPDALIVEPPSWSSPRFAEHRFDGDLGLAPDLPTGQTSKAQWPERCSSSSRSCGSGPARRASHLRRIT